MDDLEAITERAQRIVKVLRRLAWPGVSEPALMSAKDVELHEALTDAEAVSEDLPPLLSELRRVKEALERIAHLTDGQEGRRADMMMMHGFSPVKALGQARDIARNALQPQTETCDVCGSTDPRIHKKGHATRTTGTADWRPTQTEKED